MKQLFSTLGAKGILVIIAVVLGGAVVIPKVTKIPFSLESLAEKDLRTRYFEANKLPYKNVSIKTVKNDGTRALIQADFVTQAVCYAVTDKNRANPIASESMLSDEAKATGLVPLSGDDIDLLAEMGLLDRKDLYNLELDGSTDKWKHCYAFMEYIKSGDKWSGELKQLQLMGVEGSGWTIPMRRAFFIYSPKKQTELGYSVTDDMRKKVADMNKPTPTITPTPTEVTKGWIVIKSPTKTEGLRSTASYSSSPLGYAYEDDDKPIKYPLLDEVDGFYKIRLVEGKEGWVRAKFAEKIAP